MDETSTTLRVDEEEEKRPGEWSAGAILEASSIREMTVEPRG